MRMLLDETFIADLADAVPSALRAARALDRQQQAVRVPAPVLQDLARAALAAGDSNRVHRFVAHLARLEVVPFTPQMAWLAAWLEQRSASRRRPLPKGLAALAATALLRDEPLVTSRTEELKGVRGLKIRTYES